MDSFMISVQLAKEKYTLAVTRKYLMNDSERWEVRAKNHTFLLDCNRPLMAKRDLSYLPWDWKLVAGQCPKWFLQEMTMAMEKVLRGQSLNPHQG